MKKFFAIALILILALSLLTACNKGDGDMDCENMSPPPSDENPSPSPDDPAELTMPEIADIIKTTMSGMNTIQETAETVDVDISKIYEALGIPDTVPEDTLLKDIKNIIPEFDWTTYKNSATDPAEPDPTKDTAAELKTLSGMTSIKDAADTIGVDVSEIYAVLGVSDTIPEDTLLKDIKDYDPDFSWIAFKES